MILGIKDESDARQVQSEAIASILIRYYQDLFATSNPNPHMVFFDHIPIVITNDMNATLTGTFLESKIVTALK